MNKMVSMPSKTILTENRPKNLFGHDLISDAANTQALTFLKSTEVGRLPQTATQTLGRVRATLCSLGAPSSSNLPSYLLGPLLVLSLLTEANAQPTPTYGYGEDPKTKAAKEADDRIIAAKVLGVIMGLLFLWGCIRVVIRECEERRERPTPTPTPPAPLNRNPVAQPDLESASSQSV